MLLEVILLSDHMYCYCTETPRTFVCLRHLWLMGWQHVPWALCLLMAVHWPWLSHCQLSCYRCIHVVNLARHPRRAAARCTSTLVYCWPGLI